MIIKKISTRFAFSSVMYLMTGLFLSILNLYFLIDKDYKLMFELGRDLSISQKLTYPFMYKDPGYFIFQNISGIFLNFNAFFIVIIFLSLLIKFRALLSIERNISVWHVLPYLFVLSFLHEGIAVRIGLALSFGLWAIVFYVKQKWLLAILCLMIGGTIHLSVLAFIFVWLAMILYDRLGYRFVFVTLFFSLLFSLTSVVPDAMHYLGRLTNARYMAYSESFYAVQNKSGLFQYFFIFVGVLTALVWRYYEPVSKLCERLKRISVTSGCLAVVILLVFHFNVVVSSRLADLLLLPLLLVLGVTLHQLKEQRRWFLLWGMTLSLIAYGILRGVVSFKPQMIQDLLKQINSFI